MGAVLRAAGSTFDPHRFCRHYGLEPTSVHRKGEPRRPANNPGGRTHESSGFNLTVSKADFHDLPGQIADAIVFLESQKLALAALRDDPGVEQVELDFGIARRGVAVQSDSLPPRLICLAGELGLGLCLTQYTLDEE